MFPFDLDEEEEVKLEAEESKPLQEYGVDFSTGQLTGKIATGLEALKVWVWNVLSTNRYRHVLYSWDFGTEMEDLIGKSYSEEYLNSELESMIEDSLLIHEDILEIKDFTCNLEGDKLTMSFVIDTVYGEGDIVYVRG